MKKLITLILMVFILAVGVSAFPAKLNYVEFDGSTLDSSKTNRLSIDRGENYELKVSFIPSEDLDNVEIEAFISGYEYSKYDSISDVTSTFKVEANTTYVKKLSLSIPTDVDEDNYKLRIIISDRNNNPLVFNYNLKIDLARHDMIIDDVILSPSNAVESGNALIVNVRVDNQGEKDEEDVRVQFTIPQLGISAVSYIDEVDSEDEESTEDLFVRIPRCIEAGLYGYEVTVTYSDGHEDVSETGTLTILEDESCEDDSTPEESKSIIMLNSKSESGKAGDTLSYPITFSNTGKESKVFSVSADAVEWADISVSPSNSVVVSGSESKTIYLTVKLADNVKAGSKMLNVDLVSGDDVQQLTLTAEVIKPKTSTAWLEIIVIALVVIIIVLGLIVLLKPKNDNEY